jgi:hypothetical protein
MLLGRPWFRDAKFTHDQGNNVITIQGNGIIKTIPYNKKLGAETKRPQILVYYDLLERLIDEKENIIFETEPKLFSIGTIIISNEMVSLLNVGVSKLRRIEEYDSKQRT